MSVKSTSGSLRAWVAAAVTVSVIAVGGVLLYHSLTGGFNPTNATDELPPLAVEDRPLLRPSASPDPYGTFEEALASLPLKLRHLALLTKARDQDAAALKARAWAMTKSNMTGDPREVEPFLHALEKPFEQKEAGPLEPPPQLPDREIRTAAMYGLSKAAISEIDYGEALMQRMEAVAAAHIDVNDCRHNATVILMMLQSRGMLTEAGESALRETMATLPDYFFAQVQSVVANFKADEPG